MTNAEPLSKQDIANWRAVIADGIQFATPNSAILRALDHNQRLRAELEWHVANDNSIGANHAREALERKP